MSTNSSDDQYTEPSVLVDARHALQQRSSSSSRASHHQEWSERVKDKRGRVSKSNLIVYDSKHRSRVFKDKASGQITLVKRRWQSRSRVEQRYLELEDLIFDVPQPYNLLDRGHVDPFSVLPIDLPHSFVTEQLQNSEHCLVRMATNDTCKDDHGPRFARCILSMAIQHETLLYCMISGAMMYTRTARGITEESKVDLRIASKAVELLNSQMKDPSTAVQECNIWAVVVMAYCGALGQVRTGQVPQQSTLKELQSLHIYGRLTVNRTHLQGLSQLVAMVGGLNKLSTPGMASVMSYADLLESTRNLRKPLLPFVPFTDTLAGSESPGLISQQQWWSQSTLATLGTHFSDVWSPSRHIAVTSLLRVICNMRDFTIIVENYMEGRAVISPPTVLTDQRNFTQHKLMSLPTAQEVDSWGTEACDQQYESCRLACIVYSFLVIFPFPPVVGLFEKLSLRLRMSLSNAGLTLDMNLHRMKLQLWILTMGAIISIGSRERGWYLHEIRPLVASLHIENADQFAKVLKGFLWHPRTSRKDSLDLWYSLQGDDQTARVTPQQEQ